MRALTLSDLDFVLYAMIVGIIVLVGNQSDLIKYYEYGVITII